MSSEYLAFSASTVLSNFPKQVLCLEYIGERLYAGLGDGSLVLLAADSAPTSSSWQVIKAHKGFGRKYVSQLQAIRQATLLLSLSEDGVNLFTVPQLKLTCQASRTRYASRFAWSEERAMLCAAIKRKVILFHYDGREFVELKEYSAPDIPQALQWCGDAICIGVKKEYLLMQSSSGVTSEVAPTSKATQACVTELSKSDFLISQDTSSLFLGANGKLSKRPGITWSDSPVAVTFSKPYAVAILPGHIEVRSTHRLSDHGLVQSLPIAGTHVLTTCQSTGHIFVAATGSDGIHQLAPVPFHQQARALADLELFAEALTLITYAAEPQSEPVRRLEDEIILRYGHYLFGKGEYDEGLAQMGMSSSSNPVMLLHLFPSLASPNLLQPVSHLLPGAKLPRVAEPSGEDYAQAVTTLLPYLLSHRSRLAAFSASQAALTNTTTSATATTAGKAAATTTFQAATASTTARGKRGAAESAHATSEFEQVLAGRPSTTFGGGMGQEEEVPGSPERSRPQEFLASLQPEQRHQLAVLVDTAILKAMLAMDDTGALLRFVQRSNDIDLREGEAALRARGRYSELVALYQHRGQHEAALDLLHTLTSSPQDLPIPPSGAAAELRDLTGVWAAVRYLVAVGGSQTGLVKKHAGWILTVDPDAGLEMFTEMQPALPPDSVLPILAAHAPSLCATYLESAIAQGSVSAQEFDTYLAQMYLQTLMDHDPQQQPPADSSGQQPAHLEAAGAASQPDAYAKLKRLLRKSRFIDAQRLLKLVPHSQLLEVQALLHKHLGDHREALRIYLELLHDYQLAEEYCDGLYQEGQQADQSSMQHLPASLQARLQGVGAPGGGTPGGSGGDLYLLLIQAFLEQQDTEGTLQGTGRRDDEEGGSVQWQRVAQLLGGKYDRIDPVQALPLLPLQMSLRLLLPFLEGSVRLVVEQARNAAVVRSLRRSENLQIREDLVKSKQRSVLVTSERACVLCHRRIANTVFVAYPDGPLAHYSCHKKQPGSGQVEDISSSPAY